MSLPVIQPAMIPTIIHAMIPLQMGRNWTFSQINGSTSAASSVPPASGPQRASRPATQILRACVNPSPQGTVLANGSVGPFRTNDYGATPLSGASSLQNADLSQLPGISGHASASGRYSCTFSGIETFGQVAIPDFRAASAHRVQLDAAYRVLVNGTNGDVEIQDTEVRNGENLITASGSVWWESQTRSTSPLQRKTAASRTCSKSSRRKTHPLSARSAFTLRQPKQRLREVFSAAWSQRRDFTRAGKLRKARHAA